MAFRRQLEGGGCKEVTCKIESQIEADVSQDLKEEIPGANEQELAEKAPGNVDIVARSRREHQTLQRLVQDFRAAQKNTVQQEDEVATVE
ncbi:37S ribosomal protein S22 [Conoideocrella luteorostrata]|uniref:37S ribosomal protein S22 n=1 Tax=Conoideocrella luteorostrata TaxID=1105319 RepID=A0AAJ0CPQ6_9HYPO|nr:37S ribosomal protein S22 [Conoideocrella luteorostrata]